MRERFDALDSLRGVAAMAVVVNHCLDLFPFVGGFSSAQTAHAPTAFAAWLLRSPLSLAWDGRGAVAVFFVLSGFVLSLPWFRDRALSYSSFVLRRICRIYLPYLVAVAFSMALATLLASLRPPLLSLWFDTSNWVEPVSWTAIGDHLLMLGGHNTFDNPVWSLDHEMRISLVFPLLVLPLLRFGVKSALVLAIILYGAAGALTHFAGWHGAPAELAATLRFSTFFLLGAALARYADALAEGDRHGRWIVPPGLAAWSALAAGLLLLWASREPAIMAAASGLVILSAILPGAIRGALRRRVPRALGRVSYSLYLTHLPVILSAVYLLHGRLPLPAIVVLSLLVVLPVSWLFNRLVEEPANRLGRRLTREGGGRKPLAAIP